MAQIISFEGRRTLYNFLKEESCQVKLFDVAIDLCKKVMELHDLDVIHHDLKRDNVLVDDDNGVHIIDFGNANKRGRYYNLVYEKGVNCCWLAPEVFGMHRSCPAYDAYSVGSILYDMAPKMSDPNFEGLALQLMDKDPHSRMRLSNAMGLL